jgi:hypothetical protein
VTNTIDRRSSVFLAMQVALLGEVSSELRAVSVSWSETSIHYDCYFDGEVGDENRDSMSCVETELIAMYPETHVITHEIHRIDYPVPLPQTAERVYRRREFPFVRAKQDAG